MANVLGGNWRMRDFYLFLRLRNGLIPSRCLSDTLKLMMILASRRV